MLQQESESNIKSFYAVIIAFTLYVFASSVLTGLPYVGIVAFAVLPLFIFNLNKSVYYTFFLLPFSWYFPGYVILFIFFILLFKCKGANKQIQFSFTAIIVILELVHLLLCPFPVDWFHAISPLAFIALFFFLLFFQNDSVKDSQCIKFYCIGSCLAVFLSYYMIISAGGVELFMSGAFRSGNAESLEQDSIILNSNSAAFLSLTSFVCLLFSKERLGLHYILYICFLVLSFFLGLCSFSRTYLLLVSIAILSYLIIAEVKNKYKIVLVGVLCAIVISAFFPSFTRSIFDVFFARLTSYDLQDAGGRTKIFAMYNRWLINNPDALLWGTGINYYSEITNLGHATHNGLQQILVCTGVIGVFLYIVVASRFYKLFKTNSTSFSAVMPFLLCFVFDQSIQFLMPQFLMFPFVAAAYMFRINSRN